MIELEAEKEYFSLQVKEKNDAITECNAQIINLETAINNSQTQIEENYAGLQKQITTIFDDFRSRIICGRIFTDVILDSAISAYKSGFIEFLPEYYSDDQVAERVREIEQTTNALV